MKVERAGSEKRGGRVSARVVWWIRVLAWLVSPHAFGHLFFASKILDRREEKKE